MDDDNTQPIPQHPVVPQPFPIASKPNTKHKILFGFFAVIILGLVGIGGYMLGANSKKSTSQEIKVAVASPTAKPTTIPLSPVANPTLSTTPLTMYTDKFFDYTISYPKNDGSFYTWGFRQTYGPDIQKSAPTDILSGID
ncbi:MAG: hypothetical protein ACREGI_04840, partial [Candidatus Levyibacteriota bacterium]